MENGGIEGAPAPAGGAPRAAFRGAMSHPFSTAILIVAVLTVVRVAVVFLSPLELYPDEAQYWLWSRRLAFGYFSKPPMIAWLIRATTALGGQHEAWIRLAAPLLHGGAGLLIGAAARRFYGPFAGALAALIYTLAPGVQLSSAVIATDAPLMLGLGLALWAYACWWTVDTARERTASAAALGAALGLAFLSKYAGLYFVGGMALHAAFSREARRRWRPIDLAATIGIFLLIASPNLIWNAAHHFQTVAHTAADADWSNPSKTPRILDPRGAIGFIFGQFGVFGPIPFAVVILGSWLGWRRRTLTSEDGLLLALAAPPMLIVLGEAVVARANANWAGAAYAPCAALAAGFLVRWGARRTIWTMLAMQGAIAAIFLMVFARPPIADAVGFANSFKRARGWAASAAAVEAAAGRAGAKGPLTAVAVDDRFLFNALSYYARDARNRPAGALPAPLTMWVREAKAQNQAEATAPLTPALGRRALVANVIPDYRGEIVRDFTTIEPGEATAHIALDPRHQRPIDLFVGDGFAPQRRDPKSGLPPR